MKVEKLEVLGIVVPNLDEAIKLFSEIFETEFVNYGELKGEDVEPGEIGRQIELSENMPMDELPKAKMAIDRQGLIELIEFQDPAETKGFRFAPNIHIKVPDIEECKAELKQKGIRIVAEVSMGGYKEAVALYDDLFHMIYVFCEYDAPSLADALLQ